MNINRIRKLMFCFLPTAKATFFAIQKTYSYLTPDLWKEQALAKGPYQEYSDYLMLTHRTVGSSQPRPEHVVA